MPCFPSKYTPLTLLIKLAKVYNVGFPLLYNISLIVVPWGL